VSVVAVTDVTVQCIPLVSFMTRSHIATVATKFFVVSTRVVSDHHVAVHESIRAPTSLALAEDIDTFSHAVALNHVYRDHQFRKSSGTVAVSISGFLPNLVSISYQLYNHLATSTQNSDVSIAPVWFVFTDLYIPLSSCQITTDCVSAACEKTAGWTARGKTDSLSDDQYVTFISIDTFVTVEPVVFSRSICIYLCLTGRLNKKNVQAVYCDEVMTGVSRSLLLDICLIVIPDKLAFHENCSLSTCHISI